MTDLEHRLRNLLDEQVRDAPAPFDAISTIRRAHRRQTLTLLSATFGVALIATLSAITLGSLLERDPSVPADRPATNQTMHGISITFPESWYLIEPDEAGLNGTDPTEDLPKLVLALSPQPPSEMFACPGMVESAPPTFLMTVQEQPPSLTGVPSALWPATLEPLEVPAAESGCYPGWMFQQASWTAEGRTFEAVVGTSPAISDADRTALLAAFGSMTFAPSDGPATSATIATGTTGGEDWQLAVSTGPDGLELTLQGELFGAGGSTSDPASEALGLATHVLGEGEAAGRLVWATIPATVVRLVGTDADGAERDIPVVDVPDQIDPRANAFVVEIPVDGTIAVEGFDANGELVAYGRLGPERMAEAGMSGLEDGMHFGFVRAVDVEGRTIQFDLAIWLTGEEANQAYEETTGETGGVPNDYFVVNDSSRLRTLSLAPDLRLRLLNWARCCDTFFDGDLGLFAQAIATESDVTDGNVRYAGVSQYWVTVHDGVVTEIEEQYAP